MRSQSLSLYFCYIDYDHDLVGYVAVALGFSTLGYWGITILGTQAGGSQRSGTEDQDEHMGAFTGLPPLPCSRGVISSAHHRFEAGEGTDAEMLFALCSVRYCRTPQAKSVSALSQHRITVVRRSSYSVRVFPRAALLVVICPTDLACALARIYNSVRCVKSESFEALPRWLE